MIADDIKIYLRAETKAAVAAMKRAQKQTQGLEGQMRSMAKTATRTFGAYAAAALSVRAVVRTMRASIAAYSRQIQAEASLEQAILNTGGAVHELLPQYKQLASEIQNVTTVGDEAALELSALAISLGIAEDKIGDATRGAVGLAQAFGMSTQAAVRGIANAFEGNFTALDRYIPALRTATSEAEKMDVLHKAMGDGFELAKAQANTAAGALQQYRNRVGDLKEEFGRVITEGIEPFVRGLNGLMETTLEAIESQRDLRRALDAVYGRDADSDPIAHLNNLQAGMTELEGRERELISTVERLANSQHAQSRAAASQAQSSLEDVQAQIAVAKEQIKIQQRIVQQQRLAAQADDMAAERARAAQAASEEASQAELDRLARYELALQKRADLHEEYEHKMFLLTATSVERIERERERALADAKAHHVVTGKEIEQLNAYYDSRIVASKEAKQQEIIDARRKAADQMLQIELERMRQEEAAEREHIATKKAMYEQLVGYAANLTGSISRLWSNSYDQQIRDAEGNDQKRKQLMQSKAVSEKNAASFQAGINTSVAVTRTMSSVPYPMNIPLAAAQGIAGLAEVAAIQSTPIPAYASGADFTTSGPQMIMVGDNPGGKERVRIDPQPDSRQGGSLVLNFSGVNVYGVGGAEKFAAYIVDAIKRGQRAGRIPQWA